MRTFQYQGNDYKLNFHYDSDFSGNVIITDGEGWDTEIPGEALLGLMFEYMRDRVIAELEVMEID